MLSLTASRLHYGIVFWGMSPAIQNLLVKQKAIIRCIFGASLRDSYKNLFLESNTMTLTVFIKGGSTTIHDVNCK